MLKKGKIVSLVKDSSAARNGLLTHHYICEVNGQNVIGMKVWTRLCAHCSPHGTTAWSEGTPAVGMGLLGADCRLGAVGLLPWEVWGFPHCPGCEVGICHGIS